MALWEDKYSLGRECLFLSLIFWSHLHQITLEILIDWKDSTLLNWEYTSDVKLFTNRAFPFRLWRVSYTIKTRQARNTPSRGLWVPLAICVLIEFRQNIDIEMEKAGSYSLHAKMSNFIWKICYISFIGYFTVDICSRGEW